MRPAHVLKALIAIFFIVIGAVTAHAQQLLPVPPLTGHVVDTSGTLQPAEIAALASERRLRSPLVLQRIDDALAGRHYPLDVIHE